MDALNSGEGNEPKSALKNRKWTRTWYFGISPLGLVPGCPELQLLATRMGGAGFS